MSIQTFPSYTLGQSSEAEYRLELLNEVASPDFLQTIISHFSRKGRNVRILNIGCGSGHLEERMSKMVSESHFIGIDISNQRIEEAKQRSKILSTKNTYQFISADLRTLTLDEIGKCDLLISRFVLSHLSEPLTILQKFIPLVKPGGLICIEECASDFSEFYCNISNPGYHELIEISKVQAKLQNSYFNIGLHILSKFLKEPGNLIHSQIFQSILRTPEHKSILRLGIEDMKVQLIKEVGEEKIKNALESLRKFEQDSEAYGLYIRSMVVIFQLPFNDNR